MPQSTLFECADDADDLLKPECDLRHLRIRIQPVTSSNEISIQEK